MVLNVNGVNITDSGQTDIPRGSTFKTFPLDTDTSISDTFNLLLLSNSPASAEVPNFNYAQTLRGMIAAGNVVKDNGQMSCVFLWHEFFKFFDKIRRKTNGAMLIPFAMGIGDGEAGFNINSKFAASYETDNILDQNGTPLTDQPTEKIREKYQYNSNRRFNPNFASTEDGRKNKELNIVDEENGESVQNIPLYRYFVPRVNKDPTKFKSSPFEKRIDPSRSFESYNFGQNLFWIMDSGYLANPTTQIKELDTAATAAATTGHGYRNKFASYFNSLYPFCKTQVFDRMTRRTNWVKTFQDSEFVATFEMGDGGFRQSRPLKDDKPVDLKITSIIGSDPQVQSKNFVYYVGQGQLQTKLKDDDWWETEEHRCLAADEAESKDLFEFDTDKHIYSRQFNNTSTPSTDKASTNPGEQNVF